jgi:hypothetical protein
MVIFVLVHRQRQHIVLNAYVGGACFIVVPFAAAGEPAGAWVLEYSVAGCAHPHLLSLLEGRSV